MVKRDLAIREFGFDPMLGRIVAELKVSTGGA
jgi:hypothetical protein